MRERAARAFRAPSRYVQGPDLLDELADHITPDHRSAMVYIDSALKEELEAPVRRSLERNSIDTTVVGLACEVTKREIDLLAADAWKPRPDVIITVGGGKTLDTGKGVASLLGLPVVTVPTIASNDGPTSRVIAVYDDQHRLVETPRMETNPETVLVDTRVISRAPSRFLSSGIGDALAKSFEAAACRRGTGLTSNGTRPLSLPSIIADGCYRILLEHGASAVRSVQRQEVTDSLEEVVEAVILGSGLAFENGGLSLAHSMTRGLMAFEGTAGQLHGYHVAYGLLVQLVHEGAGAQEYARVASFLESVGLPVSLPRTGEAPVPESVVHLLASAAVAAPHGRNCVPPVTLDSVSAAVREVERRADRAEWSENVHLASENSAGGGNVEGRR